MAMACPPSLRMVSAVVEISLRVRALAQKRRAVAPLLSAPYDEFTKITSSLRSEDVEFVFWAASGWGAWISAHTESMSALADLPRVILLMEGVIERD